MNYEVKEFLFVDFGKVRKAIGGMSNATDEEMPQLMMEIVACGLHTSTDELKKDKELTIIKGTDIYFEVLDKNKVFFSTYNRDYIEKMKKFLLSISPKETSSQPSQAGESPPQS